MNESINKRTRPIYKPSEILCFILFFVYGVHRSSVYVLLGLSIAHFQLQGQMWKVPNCCKKHFEKSSESDGA